MSSELTTVKPPAGNEAFCFLATRNPVDFLSGADTLRETAGVANLELNPARFFQRLDDAVPRINPDDWSIITLNTVVVGR